MELIQNVPYDYPVLMVSSSDHVTGKTGVPLTIYLSKAGTPSVQIFPIVTEIGFGKYSLRLTMEMVDTDGAWSIHVDAPGCDPYDSNDQVISAATVLIPPSVPTSILETLKSLLGIDEDDSTQDATLSRLIRFAVSVVEGITKRYFGTPRSKVEYHSSQRCLQFFLSGYVDDSEAANAAYPADSGPSSSVVVARRAYRSSDSWEDLVEGDDWERRGRKILLLGFPALVADYWYEYRVTYLEGYLDAPEDIKQAITEIAMNQNMNEQTVATGLSGVTSESLGDFSYTLDSSAGIGGSLAILTDTTKATLSRYKRKFV